MKKTDLNGCKFGRLLVIGEAESRKTKSGQTKAMWKCLCDCGVEKVITSQVLLDGGTVSCGCYAIEYRKARYSIHCAENDPILKKTYVAWLSMRRRCNNPESPDYKNYGGRGIIVCQRWSLLGGEGFLNFLEDMGIAPEDMSLDRIDVDGNYSLGNCRWASASVQAFNQRRRSNNKSGKSGVQEIKSTNGISSWKVGIMHERKFIYLGVFQSFEEAVKTREGAELKYFGFTKQ